MYQLVDFGNGRKLERFGQRLVDRPCPVATNRPARPHWKNVDARFDLQENHKGTWTFSDREVTDWCLRTRFGSMNLFPTEFGHLGIFVEQQTNWNWLLDRPLNELRILNLFAYTGGSTLAAAASGASVTHIDSAKNTVRRARENACRCNLEERPIRWIVEDALKFVERESRRGNHYDGVILDPPTYGHGLSSTTTWKIDRDLPRLINALQEIIPRCQLMLFTCHSVGYSVQQMQTISSVFFPRCGSGDFQPENGAMELQTTDGRHLSLGNFVRWFSPSNKKPATENVSGTDP